MKHLFIIFEKNYFLSLFVCFGFFVNTVVYSQSSFTLTPRVVNTIDPNISGFYESLPSNYYSSSNPAGYPLIIYINGAGFEGQFQPLSTLLITGPLKIIKNALTPGSSGNKFKDSYRAGGTGESSKFIVLSIQFKYDSYNTTTRSSAVNQNTIDAMIEYAKANYNVNRSKIYLCGFSMGGGAIWNYIANSKSSKVAAVVISAGAKDISNSGASNIASKQIPILCTHNENDDIIFYSRTTNNISKINYFGTNRSPKLISWSDGKHFTSARTFEDIEPGTITQPPPREAAITGNLTEKLGMNGYEWLLQYSLTPEPPPAPIITPIHYYSQIETGPNANQSGDFFYTRDYNAIGDGSIAGFSYNGVAFNAYNNFVQGTIPIYRYFNPTYVNHFYTKTALVNSVNTYGLDYEGVEFYAYDYQYPGTIPVYRYFSPSLSNHFYTTEYAQYSYYTYERIEFYAFPANANASRMVNKDNPQTIKKDNVTDSSNIIAFPNPTTGFVNIKNNSKTIDSIIVSNMFGENIQTKTINSNNSELDISNLQKGIYFVKVKSEGEEKVMRIVKE